MLGARDPGDVAAVANLVIRCHKRDLALELAADLEMQRLLVGLLLRRSLRLDGQQEVGHPPHEQQPNRRVNTDSWYYRVFQGAPDLIRAFLPSTSSSKDLGLDPPEPGVRLFRFSAHERQKVAPKPAPRSRLQPSPGSTGRCW